MNKIRSLTERSYCALIKPSNYAAEAEGKIDPTNQPGKFNTIQTLSAIGWHTCQAVACAVLIPMEILIGIYCSLSKFSSGEFSAGFNQFRERFILALKHIPEIFSEISYGMDCAIELIENGSHYFKTWKSPLQNQTNPQSNIDE